MQRSRLARGEDEVGSGASQDDIADGSTDGSFDDNGDMTVDFGFTPSAALGNRVWLDIDRDGVQDGNEVGIPNVTVDLWVDTTGDGIPDTPVNTAVTGPDGEYLFQNLEPGVAYQVVVDDSTLVNGLEQTYDEGPTSTPGVPGVLDHASDPVVLDPNEEHLSTDFGYSPPQGDHRQYDLGRWGCLGR